MLIIGLLALLGGALWAAWALQRLWRSLPRDNSDLSLY
jgi:hypothetical protein